MRFDIPDAELEWSFDTSGGPGGQHANRAATRAEVRWDVASSPSVAEDVRRRLLAELPGLRDGVIVVSADDTRSQWRNRQMARRRLQERVDEALRPRKHRRPTRVPKRAQLKRRAAKKRRSELKKLRKPPDVD